MATYELTDAQAERIRENLRSNIRKYIETAKKDSIVRGYVETCAGALRAMHPDGIPAISREVLRLVESPGQKVGEA